MQFVPPGQCCATFFFCFVAPNNNNNNNDNNNNNIIQPSGDSDRRRLQRRLKCVRRIYLCIIIISKHLDTDLVPYFSRTTLLLYGWTFSPYRQIICDRFAKSHPPNHISHITYIAYRYDHIQNLQITPRFWRENINGVHVLRPPGRVSFRSSKKRNLSYTTVSRKVLKYASQPNFIHRYVLYNMKF